MTAHRIAMALVALGLLAACGPQAPKGVDKDKLDDAVSRAIGDPASCLLIAEAATGRQVYRYNTHTACARKLPACDAPGERALEDLLKATLKDGQPRLLSCRSVADASRWVGWAAGPLTGPGGARLAYAAMMEGTRAFPGRMMAERLDDSLKDAGLRRP